MLRGLWAVVVLVVSTTALGLPAMIIDLLFRDVHMTTRLGRVWSRVMLAAVGARVRYDGLERIRPGRPCIYVSNHSSSVDIWALLRVLPLETRFVAKRELRSVPVIGWTMAAAGFVFVDRRNRTRAMQSLDDAARTIRNGRSVMLFAEGTRSRDGTVQPFKKGPFHLALKAGVPVVPVAIRGSWAILKPRSLVVTPGVVDVRILEPLEVAAWLPDDVQGLLGRVRQEIVSALGRAS